MTEERCILEGDQPRGEVTTVTSPITPPGKGRIMTCPECQGARGRDCVECHGGGRILIRACPQCGDLGWDYVNGIDDRGGMACQLGCDYRWDPNDPGWRAQVLAVQ